MITLDSIIVNSYVFALALLRQKAERERFIIDLLKPKEPEPITSLCRNN